MNRVKITLFIALTTNILAGHFHDNSWQFWINAGMLVVFVVMMIVSNLIDRHHRTQVREWNTRPWED